MNLAYATAHRGLGMAGPTALSMAPGPYTSPSIHQRSPFAIQELLGLGQQDSGARPPSMSHPTAGADSTVISASTYIPRSLGVGVGVGAGHQHSVSQAVTTCLGEAAVAAAAVNANVSPHSFPPTWRPNFMTFSGGSHHGLMNLGTNPQSSLHPQQQDSNTGKCLTFRCLKHNQLDDCRDFTFYISLKLYYICIYIHNRISYRKSRSLYGHHLQRAGHKVGLFF